MKLDRHAEIALAADLLYTDPEDFPRLTPDQVVHVLDCVSEHKETWDRTEAIRRSDDAGKRSAEICRFLRDELKLEDAANAVWTRFN